MIVCCGVATSRQQPAGALRFARVGCWPLFAPKAVSGRCYAAASIVCRLPLTDAPCPLAVYFWRGVGVPPANAPVPLPTVGAQARGHFNYFCGGVVRARWARGGTEPPAAGTPAPRIPAGGGPRPAFRPPPRYAGERLSLRSHFFSATALGVAAAAGCAERAPASASSGVRPKPRPPAAASAASAPLVRLACATRPASVRWARPRRRFSPPSRAHCSLSNVLGLPKKPLTLRDSRSRPPRNPFFLGTLPATFDIEIEVTLAADRFCYSTKAWQKRTRTTGAIFFRGAFIAMPPYDPLG